MKCCWTACLVFQNPQVLPGLSPHHPHPRPQPYLIEPSPSILLFQVHSCSPCSSTLTLLNMEAVLTQHLLVSTCQVPCKGKRGTHDKSECYSTSGSSSRPAFTVLSPFTHLPLTVTSWKATCRPTADQALLWSCNLQRSVFHLGVPYRYFCPVRVPYSNLKAVTTFISSMLFTSVNLGPQW